MLQKIKKADPWLHSFVMVSTIIIGLAALVYMIALFAEELFLMGILGIPAAVILCLGLWAYYIFSGYFYLSALKKGFNDVAYIRYAFFFGLAGWLLICSLPKENSDVAVESTTYSVPTTAAKNNNTQADASSRTVSNNTVEEKTTEFINDQYMKDRPDIPYWCNSCGKSGPYPGSCPKCYSGVKKYNPYHKA